MKADWIMVLMAFYPFLYLYIAGHILLKLQERLVDIEQFKDLMFWVFCATCLTVIILYLFIRTCA